MEAYIREIFLYNEGAPLLFTRFYFWAFFAIVLLIYSLFSKGSKMRSAYLFAVSLFFYYKSSGLFFFILIFSTLIDFQLGKAIYQATSQKVKKAWVAVSAVLNLGLLCYFKYAYFFTNSYNALFETDHAVFNVFAHWMNEASGTAYSVNQILLPVGISFFTFQTISYSVDIYRGKLKPVRSIIDFGFYVSFFPQLVAGPIVRASEFIPQIYKDYSLSMRDFGYAGFLILNGLIKKLVIGDYLAVNFIDRVFSNPVVHSGYENLLALTAYSLQVYCDFSGYTDIAIGVALLMGFKLTTNFNSPYKATSVGDFWRRWHISLSTWLRDYLYIPLGGNKLGKLRTNVNLMITMLLGGLWHGASWQFVIWGGMNGLGLLFYKWWKRISPYQQSNHWLAHFWKVFTTFAFITFTRIWFRSESMEIANQMVSQIFTDFRAHMIGQVSLEYWNILAVMAVGFIIHWLPTSLKEWYVELWIKTPILLKLIIIVLIVFVLYQSVSSELQPFIYFQF
ncbi:MAG: MBOAT family protein [Cyclobacteriaceae bacterium]|nr:MBOAT family protein [Cyclobacteriaceae bacterium]MCH8517692.1 MBOAT family protein [Cyclobacteriaceae bacterium]